MEDVTDTVFRQVVARAGCPDVFFSEFTSTDGLFSPGFKRVKERLEYTSGEQPLIAQIWGNKPENYYKAAKIISEQGFTGIDINMGCPVKKITSKGCCSALIDNPALAKELILACQEGCAENIPVSVKTRLGFKRLQTEEWFNFLLELNLPAITVHGRLAKDQSKYPADWSEIHRVVKMKDQIAPDTVIIGNGDVQSPDEIEQKHHDHKVDGIMIGRGIFHNLLIFRKEANIFDELEVNKKIELLEYHLDLFQARWGTECRYATMKKFFKVYLKNFQYSSDIRSEMMLTTDVLSARVVLDKFKKELL